MSVRLRFAWRSLPGPLLALFLFSALPASGRGLGVQKGRKRIDTRLGLDREKGFQRIEQYLDILNPSSVVGNLSIEFSGAGAPMGRDVQRS